ncbi:hypothetical protein NONI108955_42380 [Nocardia ninae]|uniref:Uncharacterized protein n=1 Tax=Nocardia ninae NBRC 108245 TaxID=1210091 RepID=A0A511MUI8_9NOCA|nr:hypothetical protein [Nocardia ninae]GEM43817.1 hypothetical protein NN4_83360 [Nocardia ninae NBRC 108245]
MDRFTGRAYSAQLLRADLHRFTAVMLTNITETDQEPATDPEC